jgi:hypothetical protein
MSERKFSQERGPDEAEFSEEAQAEIKTVSDAYLEEVGFSGKFQDKDIDTILARYTEKGPELSPDVKTSLRKAIRRYLGLRARHPDITPNI